jgi:hypothetical protein
VFTYDNVRFADNYYQNDNAYEPLTFDFDGVVANGAFNLQLPTPVLENGGSAIEHSDVHSWYFGTITEPFAAGYAGFSGAGRNNDGDVSFPEAWWGTSGVPARTATGFAFSAVAGASRAGLPITGSKIAADAVPTVFDGDMSLGSDGFFSDSLPGWELHGGGGGGPLGGGDLYVELNAGGEEYFRRHNPLYFPRHTTAVEYDYWINDATPDDQLQVLVGNFVIDAVPLSLLTTGFVRDRRAAYALPQGGVVATLEFRIHDAAGDGIESAVRFDNVTLVIQPPSARADFDADGDVDGADFLTWQRGLGTFVAATASAGDADRDGNVTADDLAVWRGQFGSAGGAAVASPAWLPDGALAAAVGQNPPSSKVPEAARARILDAALMLVAAQHRESHMPAPSRVARPARTWCALDNAASLETGPSERLAVGRLAAVDWWFRQLH